jgi:Ca2+-binding RTX toxin-like protein
VAETSTILRLNHEGVANIQILAGDGDDWVTVETAAASESETITDYRRVAVDGGEGHDILDVDGSPGDDLIEVTRFDPPCPRFTVCGRLLLPPSGARVPPQGISWTSVIADNVEHKQVAAGAGNDWIYGSIDADVIRGEAGSDVILGDSGNDLLQGDDGDNYISGDEGDDYIRGSDGNDTLDGGAGNDELMGGSIVLPTPIEMASTIPIPTVPETIIGYIDPTLAILWLLNAAPDLSNDGDDQLTGGDGDDLLFGTAGDNVLRGGRGNDVLIGASGNDHLDGGEGRNLLIGGLGSDTILSLGSDIVVTGTTTLDANQVALRAILAEWSVNRPKTVRIRNLSDGSGGGQRLNGDHFLSSAMFSGDGDTDRASARREIDWLLASDEDLVALPRPRRRRSAAFRR